MEHLKLRVCDLNDDAVCSLARGLKHSRLKDLDLRYNCFTKKGIDELYDVLNDHPTLTKEMVDMSDQYTL